MPSLPPRDLIPATPTDARIKTIPITPENAAVMASRFLRRVRRTRDGCWLLTTSLNRTGYSCVNMTIDGKMRSFLPHRVMYVHAVGPIPDGYTIDHLCERRNCVNPAHLQAVTHRQNVLQSRTNPYAINARNTRERIA